MGHRVAPARIWNDGRHWSRCTRCGCDLIRAGAYQWNTVPRGFRVVWKLRTAADIDWQSWNARRGTPATLRPGGLEAAGLKIVPDAPETRGGPADVESPDWRRAA